MKDNFSTVLFKFLEDKNLSIKDLAGKLNVSEATVSNWLKGKSLPNRLKHVLILSDFLELSSGYLLECIGNSKRKAVH